MVLSAHTLAATSVAWGGDGTCFAGRFAESRGRFKLECEANRVVWWKAELYSGPSLFLRFLFPRIRIRSLGLVYSGSRDCSIIAWDVAGGGKIVRVLKVSRP